MYFVVLQVLFHQIFIQLLEDLANHLLSSGFYALEFEQKGHMLFLHLRFWRQGQMCRVLIRRTGRTVGQTSAELCLLSYLLAAISPRASPVCCSGCTQSLVKLLDECPLFTPAVQSRKRFEEISLEKIMHKKNYSVFGRIDFYAVIKYIVCLGGSLDLEWILVTPELARVIIIVVLVLDISFLYVPNWFPI